MYFLFLGKYREIYVTGTEGNKVYFRYSLNFMTYNNVCNKSDLYKSKDLPVNPTIVKFREVEPLKAIQHKFHIRKQNHLSLIARKLL